MKGGVETSFERGYQPRIWGQSELSLVPNHVTAELKADNGRPAKWPYVARVVVLCFGSSMMESIVVDVGVARTSALPDVP